jgi:hypothetical protein
MKTSFIALGFAFVSAACGSAPKTGTSTTTPPPDNNTITAPRTSFDGTYQLKLVAADPTCTGYLPTTLPLTVSGKEASFASTLQAPYYDATIANDMLTVGYTTDGSNADGTSVFTDAFSITIDLSIAGTATYIQTQQTGVVTINCTYTISE